LIGENIEKTTEFWHFISFAKIPLGSFDASWNKIVIFFSQK
jgi:hypothetical protein